MSHAENTPGETPDSKSESDKENAEFPKGFGEFFKMYPDAKDTLMKVMMGITSTAVKLASKASEVHSKVEKALHSRTERSDLMKETGDYLRDLREVAGLTVKELSDALKLPDQSLLAAVEKGTAALSFELILRMAALLSRHDPIPFIIRLTRTYNPEIWSVLENWGIGRLPLHFERERRFMNIYRSHDSARKLSDEDFNRILEFTDAAFQMALQFALDKNPGTGSPQQTAEDTSGG